MASSTTEIGARIKKLREKSGLSQAELAKDMKVTREVVAKWETGDRDIKTEHTARLAKHFDISCDELLTGVKHENRGFNDKTGLSDKSIDRLAQKIKPDEHMLAILNYLIENEKLEWLCFAITKYSYHEYNHQYRTKQARSNYELNHQNITVQQIDAAETIDATNTEMYIEYGEYRKYQKFQLTNELQRIAEKAYKYMVEEYYPKQLAAEMKNDG